MMSVRQSWAPVKPFQRCLQSSRLPPGTEDQTNEWVPRRGPSEETEGRLLAAATREKEKQAGSTESRREARKDERARSSRRTEAQEGGPARRRGRGS